jgi:arsenate reductase (glutaredoxin)
MAIQIFGHVKCKATRAAQRFFSERRTSVQFIDIVEKGLSKGELESVARAVGGVEKLFDGQGTRAKDRGLQYLGPNVARIAQLLLEDSKLYRTPIVRSGPKASVGHDEAAWKELVEREKQPKR